MSNIIFEPITLVCNNCGCVSETNAATVRSKRHYGPTRITLPEGWEIKHDKANFGKHVATLVSFICQRCYSNQLQHPTLNEPRHIALPNDSPEDWGEDERSNEEICETIDDSLSRLSKEKS